MYINTSRTVGCPNGSDSLPLVKLGLFLPMPLSPSASDELFFAPLHPFPVLFGFLFPVHSHCLQAFGQSSMPCPEQLPQGRKCFYHLPTAARNHGSCQSLCGTS